MNKKLFFIILILLVIFNFSIYGSINLGVKGDFDAAPWFFDPINSINRNNISTSWDFGVVIHPVTFGMNLFCEYLNFFGSQENTILTGGIFNIGGNLFINYDVLSWLNLELNSGIFYNQSALNYKNTGVLNNPLLGFKAQFNILFGLTSFLELEIINKINFFLDESSIFDNMNYTVGTRFYLDLGLHFLKPYFEIDASYWAYTNEAISQGFTSWNFGALIGGSLQWINKSKQPEPKIKPDPITNLSNPDIQENTETNDNQNPEPEDTDANSEPSYTNPNLKALYQGVPGDTISFDTILFDENEITSESFETLNEIANILKDNNSLVISIYGYSEFFGDPIKELDICKIRAKSIKEYLITQGVHEEQLKLHSMGNIIMDKKFYIRIDVL